jgi:hypothetical protein
VEYRKHPGPNYLDKYSLVDAQDNPTKTHERSSREVKILLLGKTGGDLGN